MIQVGGHVIDIGLVVDGIKTHDWSQVGEVAGEVIGGFIGGAISGWVAVEYFDGPLFFADIIGAIIGGLYGGYQGSKIGNKFE